MSDPTPDFFHNLDRLRLPAQQPEVRPRTTDKGTPSSSRSPRIRGEFLKGPIPLSWLSVAARLPGKAPLAVALAIWFEAGRRRSDQITLTTAILNRFGVERKAKYRAVAGLETAGLIHVRRAPRRNPVVTIIHPKAEPGDENLLNNENRGGL